MRLSRAAVSVLLSLVAGLSLFGALAPVSPATASWSAARLNAEGFDSCTQYTAAHWNTIYANSPSNLRALGFYLGGKTADAFCFEPDATWIGNLDTSWKLIPIWDGLQAPCSSNTYLMSSDPTTAYNQGVNSAQNADIVMRRIGLGSGNVVYLDIEGYPSTCKTAAGHYIGGFTKGLHDLGYTSGVYSSACSPDMDYYTTLNNPPDDAYIAQYNGIDSANTSGSVDCVSSTSWDNHHRIHQYRGSHNVTYGGVTVNVDSDCVDGDTVSSNGSLNLTCG